MAQPASRLPFAEIGARLVSGATSYKPLALLRIGTGLILVVQGFYLWYFRALLLDPQGPRAVGAR
jgi:hypothetical protein